MPGKVKVAGTWRDSSAPYLRVGGNWRMAKSAWAKIDDQWRSWFLQGGILGKKIFEHEDNFNVNLKGGAASSITNSAIQADGKIILVGFFNTFSESTANRIVRINSDGSLDTTFVTGGPAGAIQVVSILPNGQILVGGDFQNWEGVLVRGLVRLNSDGSRDASFTNNLGGSNGGFNGSVRSITPLPNGQILVGGGFTILTVPSGASTTVNRMVRLNQNGSLDASFTTALGTGFNANVVEEIKLQSNGQIVVGGSFTIFNGVTVNRIVRLNSDGTRDAAFTTNTGTAFNQTVQDIEIQSNGQMLMGGDFSTFNNVTVNRIVRLNSDGTRDAAFTTNTGTAFNSTVFYIKTQLDGKILVGGNFGSFNGQTASRLIRLNSDGSIDTGFSTGANLSNSVNAIQILEGGNILVSGNFTMINNHRMGFVSLLNSSGLPYPVPGAAGLSIQTLIRDFAIQADGKIILVGVFTAFSGTASNRIVRLNADGTVDTAFMSNLGTGPNNIIHAVKLQSDGKILLCGSFTTWNGTSASVVRLNVDGTRDSAFNPTVNFITYFDEEEEEDVSWRTLDALEIDSNGKILVGGEHAGQSSVRRGIIRFNQDGTLDSSFNTAGIQAGVIERGVSCIAIQPNGQIILGGNFTQFNNLTRGRIVRLNADGTVDTVFSTNTGTGFNSSVLSIAVQSDGKIIIAGHFTTLNNIARNRIVRLNTDGTVDTTFMSNLGTGFNSSVTLIAIQPNGQIILAGYFTTLNNIARNRIVRLNTDGTVDTVFSTNTGTGFGVGDEFFSSIIQNNTILIAGTFSVFNGVFRPDIVRISSDITG